MKKRKDLNVSSQYRLKVLFLPAWYPSEVNPVAGIFVREHAKAASLYNDIVVLYAYAGLLPQLKGLYRVSDELEDGIRTIRVRCHGISAYVNKLIPNRLRKTTKKQSGTQPSSESGGKVKLTRLWRIPARMISSLLYSYYLGIFAGFRRLVLEGWKPDVIHAHVFTAGVPAVILGKIYNIPVVINERWSGFPLGELTLFNRIRARFAMNRAELILPTSDYLGKHIEAYGIKNKFRVVPNVINPEIFHPLTSPNRREEDEPKKLLSVTRLVPVKGVPYLLEALRKIKDKRDDFTLDIVGYGVNRGEYEDLAKKLGLGGVVTFHGLKLKAEVAKFMQRCDFFVQPSLQETFGVVYIEAMACGKPVIATSVGGPRETVNDDTGILVSPKDTEALKEAIEYMLDNYQNYSPEKIAQYANERFSYETVGSMLNAVYRSTLNAG